MMWWLRPLFALLSIIVVGRRISNYNLLTCLLLCVNTSAVHRLISDSAKPCEILQFEILYASK